jgi:single-stranded-DNA-specific exonuclease
LTDNESLALDMARELDGLNRDRKAIERDMQQQALKTLEGMQLEEADLPFGLCLYDAEWHQGVIGILASRLKDRFHRPVIAFADAGDGMVKGSARSVSGLHIRDALDAVAARHPELISKFGGHAMAAGLSLREADFPAFAAAFDAEVRRQLEAEDLTGRLLSDGELEAGDLSMDIAASLREAGPWGQHFPEPLFHGKFQVLQQRLVGERHLKLVLRLPGSTEPLDAIAFNIEPQHWPNAAINKVLLAYTLDINEFRGRQSLQLMVRHIEPADTV